MKIDQLWQSRKATKMTVAKIQRPGAPKKNVGCKINSVIFIHPEQTSRTDPSFIAVYYQGNIAKHSGTIFLPVFYFLGPRFDNFHFTGFNPTELKFVWGIWLAV